ncbi:hypothetical protein GW755_02270 [bacterium]|nr:hypothetical protein [bacterium]
MEFPYTVKSDLGPKALSFWNNILLPTKGSAVDKTIEESLWRRNQSESNKKMSGWTKESDKRRKIVYYKHQYNVIQKKSIKYPGSLILESTYIYECFTLPSKEIIKYKKSLVLSANTGKWKKSKEAENQLSYIKGDLILNINHFINPQDRMEEYGDFPENYQTLEITIKSKNFVEGADLQGIIWNVAKSGLRRALPRNKPTYIENVDRIIKHLPCQIELGCGAAFEAGVPPLHELHDTYFINEPFTKKFIITAEKDLLMKYYILNTEKEFKLSSRFYSKVLTAKLTPFYKILQKLYKKNYVVGPIITNNFDGVHLRMGIPELYIRTYTESEVMPNIDFHPEAKSLLVVGCHADRRNIEMKARDKGLKVIYIDPEGWWVKGNFIEYKLESPQQKDLIYSRGASDAFLEIGQKLLSNKE